MAFILDGLCTVNEFLLGLHVDNINPFKLLKFLKKSQLSRKLQGFAERMEVSVSTKTVADADNSAMSESAFWAVERFLSALTNSEEDGRIVTSPTESMR